jgi:hypothetical protein
VRLLEDFGFALIAKDIMNIRRIKMRLITKLLLVLTICFGLSGCAEGTVYSNSDIEYRTGSVEFCDDYGCRDLEGVQYYYDPDGTLFYWDVHFGIWVGPHGWYSHGVFYHGFYAGYHTYYHRGLYHEGHAGGNRGGGGHPAGGKPAGKPAAKPRGGSGGHH